MSPSSGDEAGMTKSCTDDSHIRSCLASQGICCDGREQIDRMWYTNRESHDKYFRLEEVSFMSRRQEVVFLPYVEKWLSY